MRRLYLVVVFVVVCAGLFALFVIIERVMAPNIAPPETHLGDPPKPLRP
jgi:hypothetical protein